MSKGLDLVSNKISGGHRVYVRKPEKREAWREAEGKRAETWCIENEERGSLADTKPASDP